MHILEQLHDRNMVYAKLAAPASSSRYIPRPALFDKLQNSLDWQVVLVSTPVGYGKTAILCDWYHTLSKMDGYEVAWLTLDEADSDIVRARSHFLAMLENIWPQIQDTELSVLKFGDEETFSTALSNFLYKQTKGSDKHYVLFFDSFDAIPYVDAKHKMEFLAESLPSSITTVAAGAFVSSRYTDYRFRNAVRLFTVDDLAMSEDETKALLRSVLKTDNCAEIAHDLHVATRGWIMGICLYIDAIKSGTIARDRKSLDYTELYSLTGRFFTDCIFRVATEEVATFLVETSILDTFHADVCDYLMEQQNSKETIKKLIELDYFIEPVSGNTDWYRYHPLFLHWLREQLMQLRPDQIRKLCQRAGEWQERHRHFEDAAKSMLMSGDSDIVESIVSSAGFERRDKSQSFVSWAIDIPAAKFSIDPALSLMVTWSYICWGRPKDALRWLAKYEENIKDTSMRLPDIIVEERAISPSIIIQHVKTKCREFDGHYHEAIETYLEMLETQGDDMGLSLRCILIHALAESYERVGEYSLAQESYFQGEAIAELAKSLFFTTFCRIGYCWTMIALGNYNEAREVCYKAIRECPPDFTLYGGLYSILTLIQVERNELSEASKSIKRSLKRLSVNRNPDMLIEAKVVNTLYLAACGELKDAYRLSVQTSLETEENFLPRGVQLFALAVQAQVSYLRGTVSDTIAIHKKLLRKLDSLDEFYVLWAELIKAYIQHSQNDSGSAMATVQQVIKRAEKKGLNQILVAAYARYAVWLDEARQKAASLENLNKALSIASSQRMIRPFLYIGDPLKALLHEIVHYRRVENTIALFAKKVLQAFKENEHVGGGVTNALSPIAEVDLTKREAEVYSLLNMGMSRQEIAENLSVSLNTVKTHLNNIYSKLGVSNRMDAYKALANEE